MVTAIAATLTTFDRIAKVPATTWWTLAAIIAGIFAPLSKGSCQDIGHS
jgi:hypothetical protein